MAFITRIVSMTNFAVASSALGFQVFVLYPWHKELDESFEQLKRENVRVIDAVTELAKEVNPGERKEIRDSILGRLGITMVSKR
jgi:solute carrier family 25 (mitochondrial phosphate transporter), member 3